MLRKAFKITIFLAIGFLMFVVGPAFADIGDSYYTKLQSVNEEEHSRTYQLVSSPARMWDGAQWNNYFWGETAQYVRFESQGVSFEFYKNTCDFKLYSPGMIKNNLPVIESYSHRLSIDGSDFPLPECSINEVTTDNTGIHFTASRDLFSTVYDLHYLEGLEWTHIINNNQNKEIDVLVSDICPTCQVLEQRGNVFLFDKYHLDTKNDIHNTVSRAGMDKGTFLIDYSKTIQDKESLIIDPTFSSSSGTRYTAEMAGTAGAACSSTGDQIGTSASTLGPRLQGSTGGTDPSCVSVAYETDISPIGTNAVVDSVNFELTTDTEVNVRSCDYTQIENQPSSLPTDAGGAEDLWDDIHNGTTYLSNPADDVCLSATTTDFDLGANAVSDIQNQIDSSSGWFAVGQHYTSESRDTSNHQSRATSWTLTVEYTEYDPPEFTVLQSVDNVGDIFKVSGSISITLGQPFANLTNISVRQNGTLVNSNSTMQNGTAPYSVNYGPFWIQATDDDVRNFTTTASVQNHAGTITNETKEYSVREYDPSYIPSVISSQGDVNYTKPNDAGIKVNRDKSGATFQIECTCLDYADAFLNQSSGSAWFNETVTGYHQYECPQGTAITACYNDDLLFITSYPANGSTILVSGTAMFDQLGGFLGAPAALLVVLAIYSLGTGRNFPIISVVAMAALGVMGALGLMVLSGEIWALLMVITGLSIFGVRKFF